jgi:phytoene/squalene synthetase
MPSKITPEALRAARDAFKEKSGITIYLPDEGTLDDFEQGRYDGLCAALSAALSSVEAMPDGWVMVPKEPTREMWAAMADTLYGYKSRHHDKVVGDLWKAMLSVAPPSLAGGE